MAIPNTTPTPNELYNGEMKKMTDTELRIVLITTRATLGWEIDRETGMRKKEDWISHRQLMLKSGRSSRAISQAIDNCIKQGWIEIRDKNGELLDTKDKRIGNKMFFRLGRIFLDKLQIPETPAESKEVENQTPAESKIAESKIAESKVYKRNTITKEKHITKDSNADGVAGKEINDLIGFFKEVNPNYEILFKNKNQRVALERMVKKFGFEKMENGIKFLPQIIGQKYAPTITTPIQLENKMGELINFIKKERSGSKSKVGIIQ